MSGVNLSVVILAPRALLTGFVGQRKRPETVLLPGLSKKWRG